MSDSEKKEEGGIPSWQKQTPEESKEKRIAQAERFIEADEVRDASAAKKIAFLEKKGYSKDEAQGLVEEGETQNPEAAQSAESITKPDDPKAHDSTSQTQQQTPVPQQDQPRLSPRTPPHTSPSQNTQASQQSQPPIITYPEFLTKPTSPRPMVTSSRLLTTLTLFSSLSILLYGSNKYLLAPMQEELTRSRHELLELASNHLSTLNAKLEDAVSEQPVTASPCKDTEEDGSDSDPTEMFQRDIGVQTSPSLLNASLSKPSSPPSPDSNSAEKSPLESQVGRIAVLNSHISELNDDSTSEGSSADVLTTTLDVFREYLENMAFTPPAYTFGGNAYSGMVRDVMGGTKEEPDEIAKLKASIRSVKGVLLSARSFPSSVRMMSNGMAAASAR